MLDLIDRLQARLSECSARLDELPRVGRTYEIRSAGETVCVIDLEALQVGTILTEPAQAVLSFRNDEILQTVVEAPERAWSLSGKGDVRATDRLAGLLLLEILFPGALAKSIAPRQFRTLFPALVAERSPETTEAFFSVKAPQRLEEGLGPLRTTTAAYEFRIEGAGIWTIDTTEEARVYQGPFLGSNPKKVHTIETTRQVFEEILADDAKAWPRFNDGSVVVSNACRAQQITRVLWPSAFAKSMPPALYRSLFPATLRSASAGEYNRTQGSFETYVTGVDGPVPINYSRRGNLAIFQGDIILGTVEEMEAVVRHVEDSVPLPRGFRIINLLNPDLYVWPDGKVFYSVDGGGDPNKEIQEAIDHWEANTPITFHKRTDEDDYIEIQQDIFCAADVGRRGGKQSMILSKECSVGNIIHEIGHAVGLLHEHTRPDRDDFVTIMEDQIEAGKEDNFTIWPAINSVPVGDYDYGSVMHYGEDAFAIGKDPTIVPNESVEIGQRDGLSEGDIATVAALYE